MTAIRRLVPADAAAYVALRLAALEAHPAAFTSGAEEERRRPLSWAEARIADPSRPDDLVLGAFESGRLVGVAGLERGARPKERHKAKLFGMAVAPEAAGRGIGGRLLARLVAEARAVPGLMQILLTVTEGNAAAERLYAARGFAVWGREPRAVMVGGVALAKLHMVLALDGPAPSGSAGSRGSIGSPGSCATSRCRAGDVCDDRREPAQPPATTSGPRRLPG